MRCEDSYLIVRVVYKNPAVQQAFSGLSLCLIKNEKWKNLKIQKNIIYSYLGRESNQKSII
jgi:hypothetical protein